MIYTFASYFCYGSALFTIHHLGRTVHTAFIGILSKNIFFNYVFVLNFHFGKFLTFNAYYVSFNVF